MRNAAFPAYAVPSAEPLRPSGSGRGATQYRPGHGRRSGLGRHGLQRPAPTPDAELRRAGPGGPPLRSVPRRGPRLLPDAGQRADGPDAEPVRVFPGGVPHPPTGGDGRGGAWERRLPDRALRQVAPRLGAGGEPGESRRQRLRRLGLVAKLLRPGPDPERRGTGRPVPRRQLRRDRGRGSENHPRVRGAEAAVPGGGLVRVTPRPFRVARRRPRPLRRPAEGRTEFPG